MVFEHGPLYDSMDLKGGIVISEEKLLQIIRDEDVNILLCGNLNARTGCKQPKLDDASKCTPGSKDDNIRGDWADRRSKYTVVNNCGKSLLNLCFMLDCVILNGCCDGDRSGIYTYVSPHGSSVINYFIMSEDLFSANCNLRLSDRVDSWHMPLELCWNNVAHDIEKPAATKSRDERACCIIR